MQRLLEIVQQETGQDVGVEDSTLVQNITAKFNDSLIFDPSQARMAYTIRDPVFFGRSPSIERRIYICSITKIVDSSQLSISVLKEEHSPELL